MSISPSAPQALQNTFERLERGRSAVFSRLEGLDDERLNRQREDGGWSAIQVMNHLIKAETRALAEIRKRMATPENLKKVGLACFLKSNLLSFMLRLPLRFKAPAPVAEVPERQDFETTRRLWDEVRASWKEFIDTFPAELVGQAIFPHPVTGDMDIHQTLQFMESHFNRHAKQIDRVVGSA